jgi:hypothetical protein
MLEELLGGSAGSAGAADAVADKAALQVEAASPVE